MKSSQLPSATQPHIRLFGEVDQTMLSEFFRQQDEVPSDVPLVFELSTSGGDAEVGRRIAEELRLWQREGREIYFIGKTYVFSAGVTIMAAIPPSHRYLTADTELLIHERKMKQDLHLDGALRGCRSTIQDVLAEIEWGQRLEHEDFARLVDGTALTADDVSAKVMDKAWYLTAEEAEELGLVHAVM